MVEYENQLTVEPIPHTEDIRIGLEGSLIPLILKKTTISEKQALMEL